MKRKKPKEPEGRDWFGRLLFKIIGPATVEGAMQGNSAEAREQWKRYVQARKQARDEQQRKQR
jgi:hypothetical protein